MVQFGAFGLINHKYKISPLYIKKQGYDKYKNKDLGNGIILVIAYKN